MKDLQRIIPFAFFHFLIGATPGILVPYYDMVRAEIFSGSFFLLSISEGVYVIMFGAFSIFWGYLATITKDRKILIFLSVLFFFVSTQLLIVVTVPLLFILFRAIEGFSLAAGYPLISMYIAENFDVYERTSVFSILILAEISGSMVAPGLSILFYGFGLSWRFIMLFLLMISALDMLLLIRYKKSIRFLEDVLRETILGYEAPKLKIRRILKLTNVLIAIQAFFLSFSAYTVGRWMIFFIASKFNISIVAASFTWLLGSMVYFSYIISNRLDVIKKEKGYTLYSLIVGLIIFSMGLLYVIIAIIPGCNVNYNQTDFFYVLFDLFGRFGYLIISTKTLFLTFILLGIISLLSGVPSPAILSLLTDSNLFYERSIAVSFMKLFDSIGGGLGIVISGLLLDWYGGNYEIVMIISSVIMMSTFLFWLILSRLIDEEVAYNRIIMKKFLELNNKRLELLNLCLL